MPRWDLLRNIDVSCSSTKAWVQHSSASILNGVIAWLLFHPTEPVPLWGQSSIASDTPMIGWVALVASSRPLQSA